MIWLKKVWDFLNSKLFLMLLSVFLTSFSGIAIKQCNREKENADRWESNYTIEVLRNDTLRDQKGKLIIRTQSLKLTVEELKRSKDSAIIELLEELSNSKIRLRQVEGMITIKQDYNRRLEMLILNKDSLIKRLEMPEEISAKLPPLLISTYEDEFTKANIMHQGNKWILTQKITNQISAFLYHQRKKKKIIFFNLRIGKKEYWFDFKETNPSITTDLKLIEVKRGRR